MGQSSKIFPNAIARKTCKQKSPTADWERMVQIIAAMNDEAKRQSRPQPTDRSQPGENQRLPKHPVAT